MPTPLLSVLTAVYNAEKYLSACIESVLASSFVDFEFVIVDDCSKDRSYEIALNYRRKDARIRLYRNGTNLGDYPNRNQAASYATGKYLKYVDNDDYVYSHGLELLVKTMEQLPEAGWGLASLEPDKRRPFPFLLSPAEAYQRHYFEQPLFHKAPLSAIIRADAFRAVGGFSSKRYVGDYEMWHVLGARFPVVLMPQGVVWYREHPEQESQSARASRLSAFAYFKVALDQLSGATCPLSAAEKVRAIGSLKRTEARIVLRTLSRGRFADAREMRKRAGMGVAELFRAAFANAVRNSERKSS